MRAFFGGAIATAALALLSGPALGAAQSAITPPDGAKVAAACPDVPEQTEALRALPADRRARGLGCMMSAAAAQIAPQLPIMVDAVTRLDRLTVEGTRLSYVYTIDRDASSFRPSRRSRSRPTSSPPSAARRT
jgi:hypothetical protein